MINNNDNDATTMTTLPPPLLRGNVTNSTDLSSFIYHYPPGSSLRKEIIVNAYDNNLGVMKKYHEENTTVPEFFQDDIYMEVDNNGIFKESALSPVLFVIDFDHTLAVYDELYILEKNTTNNLPSVYTRPHMYQFLNYIKSINTNNILILWTAGTDSYIKQNLLLLNIAHYFDIVLSRKHCKESKKYFNGKSKSHAYIAHHFPQYKRMRSVLIDNFAHKNGSSTGYTEVLSVKPYTLRDVVEMYGAYNIYPEYISDTLEFVNSKGTSGYYTTGVKKMVVYDITLLNIISFLRDRFFNIYFSEDPTERQIKQATKYLLTVKNNKLVLEKIHRGNNNNNNNKQHSLMALFFSS